MANVILINIYSHIYGNPHHFTANCLYKKSVLISMFDCKLIAVLIVNSAFNLLVCEN